MKMLINMRAYAVVAHQKPLCNSASLCPAFAFVSGPSASIWGTWQSLLSCKSQRHGTNTMQEDSGMSPPALTGSLIKNVCSLTLLLPTSQFARL